MPRWIACMMLLGGIADRGWSQETIVRIFSDDFSRIASSGLPVGWEVWHADHMPQRFEATSEIRRFGEYSIRVSGDGRYHTKGSLRRTIDGLRTGAYYRVTVHYAVRGVSRGINDRIFAVIKWSPRKRWRPLVPVDCDGGWIRAEVIHRLDETAGGRLTVELFSGWIPEGSVYWDRVEIDHLPGYGPPEPRRVGVAVIDARPGRMGTLMENCDFYVSQIHRACRNAKIDVVCLTETFNKVDVRYDKPRDAAVAIDGPYMAKLRRAARENRVNLVGSVAELDGGVEFNTGFLIDRRGTIVDTYRKAQLAMEEILFTDRSRGDELKVMEADFGRIGILICWDYHFPEFARALALKGAEMLIVPIAGGNRLIEDGVKTAMEHVGKAIAMENRVPVVFARRTGGDPRRPSRIIDHRARVLAASTGRDAIAATVVLGQPVYHWGGSAYVRSYFTSRRPGLYGILSDDRLRLLGEEGPVRRGYPVGSPR